MATTLYYSETQKNYDEEHQSSYCGEVCYYNGNEEGYYCLCNQFKYTEYKTHPIPQDSIRIGVEGEEVKCVRDATLEDLKICGEKGFLGKTLEEVKSKLENLA